MSGPASSVTQSQQSPAASISVELRRATIGESVMGRLWSVVKLPYTFVFELLPNTAHLLRGMNPRKSFATTIDKTPYMGRFNTLVKSWLPVKSVAVMQEVYKHPRNDQAGFFKAEGGLLQFVEMLKEAFPEEKMTEEDFNMSCQFVHLDKFRAPILKFLAPKPIESISEHFRKATAESFKSNFPNRGSVNITHATRLYACEMFCRFVIGYEGQYEKISQAVDTINQTLLNRILRNKYLSKIFYNVAEEEKYSRALHLLREVVLEVIDHPRETPLGNFVEELKQAGCDKKQLKGMLLPLFFAGLETTAASVNYTIWQLARKPELQEQLYADLQKSGPNPHNSTLLNNVLSESLRLFTPIYSVPRTARHDLTCIVEEKNVSTKIFVPSETMLNPSPTFSGRDPVKFAPDPDAFRPDRHKNSILDWLPFGGGVHKCPGQWFAREEMKQFIAYLILNYKFEARQMCELELKGMLTLRISEEVFIEVTPRSQA